MENNNNIDYTTVSRDLAAFNWLGTVVLKMGLEHWGWEEYSNSELEGLGLSSRYEGLTERSLWILNLIGGCGWMSSSAQSRLS